MRGLCLILPSKIEGKRKQRIYQNRFEGIFSPSDQKSFQTRFGKCWDPFYKTKAFARDLFGECF
jgi:hypothetical protein